MSLRAVPAAVMLDQFVAQELPAAATKLDVATLAPHHRCLLVTDGTVTSLVRAYALEQIRTRLMEQVNREPTAHERRWLCLTPAQPIIARRVAIEGAISGTTYLRASSLIVAARLPPAFLDVLRHDNASIGSALIQSAIEHRRELLWCQRRPGTLASRTYRIFINGVPAFLIDEDVVS